MKHRIKWSFEVPIPHLQEFHEEQDFILVLHHLCKDEEYLKYLKECNKPLILDNSSNEKVEPCTPEELCKAAQDIHASLIIAPDNDKWNIQETVNAWVKTQNLAKVPVFGVYRTREEMKALEQAGCRFFTIPYEYRFTLPLHPPYGKTHFLGLNNPLEIRVFKPASVDTGMPIKLALRGMTVQDWLMQACPHFHTLDCEQYLHQSMTQETITLTHQNIKDLKEVCENE